MKIQERLHVLRGEYARGQAQMKALEEQQRDLRDTLLRISGAIQVLEELLAQGAVDSASGSNGAKTPAEAGAEGAWPARES